MSINSAYHQKAINSLHGLSIGEGYVSGSWNWGDSTAIAIGIVKNLLKYGKVNQEILLDSGHRESGAAVSPIGVFYGPEFHVDEVIASITHYDDDVISRAVAVALAANAATYGDIENYWRRIVGNPFINSKIGSKLKYVSEHLFMSPSDMVVAIDDTVSYALYLAYHCLLSGNLKYALDTIMTTYIGNTDILGAMVGGIVANRVRIPKELINKTEPLPNLYEC